MFGWWRSPLAYCVGVPLGLAGAATTVMLMFPWTVFAFYEGVNLASCLGFVVGNIPIALVGTAPGLIVGEIINDLANRRG
jgi:hypothetical protein